MMQQLTCEEMAARIAFLERESEHRARLEKINAALFHISEAVSTTPSMGELYQKIHAALSPVIDTTNFYIALYEKSDDSLTFPYCVDTVDSCYPRVINVSKTASLTAEVVRRQMPMLIRKKEILDHRMRSGLVIPSCTTAEVWLGVPLKTPEGIIGVLTVQSYLDPDCFDETDMHVLLSVADMVATALERKRVLGALRESEEKFRRIITTVREGILSMDSARTITFANDHLAAMLGYGPGELVGMAFEKLLHAEDREDFAVRQQEREQLKNDQFERRLRTRQGGNLWAIISASPLVDDTGCFAGAFGTVTDITQRKKMETALQETIVELRRAMEQIKTLRGIVPICMNCKKIRDDKGYWNQVEVYVRNHTEAEFSHGICPECVVKLYPEYDDGAMTDDSEIGRR